MDSKDALLSFDLESFGFDKVIVRHPKGITREQIEEHDGFKTWMSTLRYSLRQQNFSGHSFHDNKYVLKEIEIQNYDLIPVQETQVLKKPTNTTKETEPRQDGTSTIRETKIYQDGTITSKETEIHEDGARTIK